jgi:hypothetical protein
MPSVTPLQVQGDSSVPLAFFRIDGAIYAWTPNQLSRSEREGTRLVWKNATLEKLGILLSERKYDDSPETAAILFEAINASDESLQEQQEELHE